MNTYALQGNFQFPMRTAKTKAGDIDPVTVKIANWLLIRQPEL